MRHEKELSWCYYVCLFCFLLNSKVAETLGAPNWVALSLGVVCGTGALVAHWKRSRMRGKSCQQAIAYPIILGVLMGIICVFRFVLP